MRMPAAGRACGAQQALAPLRPLLLVLLPHRCPQQQLLLRLQPQEAPRPAPAHRLLAACPCAAALQAAVAPLLLLRPLLRWC
jgi:hypothetical protein